MMMRASEPPMNERRLSYGFVPNRIYHHLLLLKEWRLLAI